MSRSYKCPACQNEVDGAAVVCSNAACRAALAFCPYCRDITTYTLMDKRKRSRDLYRCDRCQGVSVKCLNWLRGGYCNGLARSGERSDSLLCAACSGRMGEVARSVVSWTIIGAFGGLLKRK